MTACLFAFSNLPKLRILKNLKNKNFFYGPFLLFIFAIPITIGPC